LLIVPPARRDRLTLARPLIVHISNRRGEERFRVSEHSKKELDRHFAWFQKKLPAGPARFVGWLRKPSSILVRIPLAILLMLGGIFSILPVLGLWMLPLGLVLFAQDVPFLQTPIVRALGWVERKWIERQLVKAERERVKNAQ
jgi:hypothetical protein